MFSDLFVGRTYIRILLSIADDPSARLAWILPIGGWLVYAENVEGGGQTLVLDETATFDLRAAPHAELDLMDLDAKLTELANLNQCHAQVMEMRLLGSMTMQEIADELATSKRTVEGNWNFTRAWLRRELLNA